MPKAFEIPRFETPLQISARLRKLRRCQVDGVRCVSLCSLKPRSKSVKRQRQFGAKNAFDRALLRVRAISQHRQKMKLYGIKLPRPQQAKSINRKLEID